MDLLIEGKRALVTGASLGIGRAVAEELAREGCDVALVARDEARLEQAAREIAAATNRKTVAVAGDIAEPGGIAALVDKARGALGGIDILVNNAGSTPEDGLLNLDDFGVTGLIGLMVQLALQGGGARQLIEAYDKRDQYGYWDARLKESFHFDAVRAMTAPHEVDGLLQIPVETRVVWGRVTP